MRPSEVREIGRGPSIREADLAGHLSEESEESGEESEADGEDSTSNGDSIRELLAEDYQLREAFSLLKGMDLIYRRTTENSED